MRRQAGFTLIELIAVMVILGLISVFAGIFITTGVKGSIAARQAQENAQRAQIALQRISLELRDVQRGHTAGSAPVVTATSIKYGTSEPSLGGARTLAYDAVNKRLTLTPTNPGTAQILADGVETCTMGFTGAAATSDIVFTVTFTLTGTSAPFSITVKPRNIILNPVTS
ncbi:MAG: type II secretion system protein [Humidesulfovibrio sp.]|uniref:type II secretion system protein n=1 Tax=Humidesulfovibrio sp. TaxID=2910988 RepID=UPI00273474E7|nr:type II secretion system protein [Humidesulfovibrio sp.]MDP2848778.1 type II secretion system protein [Humidesulfovibrio sp.]